jgi:hypothetical protein
MREERQVRVALARWQVIAAVTDERLTPSERGRLLCAIAREVHRDADGRPMHSWRVLILPYLGETALFAKYNLSEAERQAVVNGDIGALYKMGVVTQAIMGLSRVFGYDTATHVSKLREAAGLPINNEQLAILKNRR